MDDRVKEIFQKEERDENRGLTVIRTGPFDTNRSAASPGENVAPKCDLYLARDHFLISLEIPGIRREEVSIRLSGNLLVVSGERIDDALERDARFRKEGRYGPFERTFVVPVGLTASEIEAEHANGVLFIAIPRKSDPPGESVPIVETTGSPLRRYLFSNVHRDPGLSRAMNPPAWVPSPDAHGPSRIVFGETEFPDGISAGGKPPGGRWR